MKQSRRRQYLVASGLGAVLAGAAITPAAGAPASETSAQSQAVLARLVPYVGLPGVTTSVGLVTAQVSSGVARSSAAAADFGLLGTLAGAGTGGVPAVPGVPAVSLPAPISADSEGTTAVERDPVAAAGGPAAPAADPSAPAAFLGKETATASEDPLGARGLVTGPTLRVPGLIEISGGIADASAAGAGGATSVVTLDRVDLGAGQVVLSGLRWIAGQKPDAAGTSGFTVRALTVAGQVMPVDGPAQLAASLEQANTVLTPLGLSLSAPLTTADATGASVAPLVVQVRNPDPLVEPSRQVSGALTPVMTELMKAVLAANEDAAAAQIVTNAVIGASGGRSGGRLELGGVNARASLVELGEVLTPVDATPVAALPPALPPAAPEVGVPPADVVAPAAAVTDAPSEIVAAAPQAIAPAAFGAPEDNKRKVATVGLGLILVVIVALAVGDRIRIAAAAK